MHIYKCVMFSIINKIYILTSVLQLREVGILHKVQVRYLKLYGEDIVNIKAITFLETWFAFAILGIGILIALLVLGIEICAPLRV